MTRVTIALGLMVFLLLGIIVFLDDGQYVTQPGENCVPTRLSPFC